MAEILGAVASGLTIAGLIKICIQAFDIIQTTRKQGIDYEKLLLKLNIERARLYVWGQEMGLTHTKIEESTALQDTPFASLVRDTLAMIVAIFQNGDRLSKIYGCIRIEQDFKRLPEPNTNAIENLTRSFSDFCIHGRSIPVVHKFMTSTRWAIKDRQKFAALIKDLKDLIDGLQDITKSISTVAHQKGIVQYGIQQIRDPDTLSIVVEVCQDSHPELSDAASIKIGVLSLATDQRRDVENWNSSVKEWQFSDINEINDLEHLTITELKTLLLQQKADTSSQSIDKSLSLNMPVVTVLEEGTNKSSELVRTLIKEKENAAQQNAQLWRLIEKQRHLILGLNADLARAAEDRRTSTNGKLQ